jgi:hypothetical protein
VGRGLGPPTGGATWRVGTLTIAQTHDEKTLIE